MQLSVDKDCPSFINSDSTRIRQILSNLVSNAIKFTDKGAVSINARVTKRAKGKSFVVIDVVDEGIGIDQEQKKYIFQSFSQADSSITRKYGGTGLGLAISSKLANLLNASLSVDSTIGKGSCFSLKFWAAEAKQGTMVPEASREKNSQVKNLSNLKVLVVEDNIINQDIAVAFLDKLGIAAMVVNNGLAAVEEIESAGDYDLILMDCQMPVLDGYSATHRIRNLPLKQQPIIIAMTANAMKGENQKCFDAGMDDYLSKPVSLDKLRLMLEKRLA